MRGGSWCASGTGLSTGGPTVTSVAPSVLRGWFSPTAADRRRDCYVGSSYPRQSRDRRSPPGADSVRACDSFRWGTTGNRRQAKWQTKRSDGRRLHRGRAVEEWVDLDIVGIMSRIRLVGSTRPTGRSCCVLCCSALGSFRVHCKKSLSRRRSSPLPRCPHPASLARSGRNLF